MRKITILFIFILFSAHLFSQKNDTTKSFSEHIKSIEPVISYIEDTLNAEIVHIQFDIISQKKDVYRVLNSKWEYNFFLISSVKSDILQLKIYEQNRKKWKNKAKSDKNQSFLSYNYKPKRLNNFKIQLFQKTKDNKLRPAIYCLIIFH